MNCDFFLKKKKRKSAKDLGGWLVVPVLVEEVLFVALGAVALPGDVAVETASRLAGQLRFRDVQLAAAARPGRRSALHGHRCAPSIRCNEKVFFSLPQSLLSSKISPV